MHGPGTAAVALGEAAASSLPGGGAGGRDEVVGGVIETWPGSQRPLRQHESSRILPFMHFCLGHHHHHHHATTCSSSRTRTRTSTSSLPWRRRGLCIKASSFQSRFVLTFCGGGGDEATSHLCMTDYPHTPPHNHTRTPHTAREAVEAKGREAGRVHHPSNLARPRPPAHPPPPPWAPAAPASNRQPTHSQGDDQITTAPAPPPRPPLSPPPPLHDDGLYLVFPAPLLLLPVPSPRHDLLLLLLLDPRPNQGRGRHTCGPPSLKRGHCGHWDRGSQARILQGDLSFSFG